jgi:hypothetical protein
MGMTQNVPLTKCAAKHHFSFLNMETEREMPPKPVTLDPPIFKELRGYAPDKNRGELPFTKNE